MTLPSDPATPINPSPVAASPTDAAPIAESPIDGAPIAGVAIAESPPVGTLPSYPGVPAPSRWWDFGSDRAFRVSLLAATLLAAFLRFFRLSHQSYWTDEAFTIKRIQGSSSDVIASLSPQGFTPGWYFLLRSWTQSMEYLVSPGHWWNGLLGSTRNAAYFSLTPGVTRTLPAIFGTLTIPAMYFLARQFVDRKTALLVAFLAAVNPFFIHFSRDIKMYQALWFFVILNTALFFKWHGSRKHLVWFPLFLATGFLMISMHSLGWFVIALQWIFLLVRFRLKALINPLWILAVAAMAALPIYWYGYRTEWWHNLAAGKENIYLAWIRDSTDLSWRTFAGIPCNLFLDYFWPSLPPDHYVRLFYRFGDADFDKHAATRSLPWLANAQFGVALGFAAILIAGVFPWRRLFRRPKLPWGPDLVRFWFLALWIVLPVACISVTWIPRESRWYKWIWHSMNVPPVWHVRYLGLIVPALLLLLAFALRRLPTRPVRVAGVVFVAGASLASACSNYFVYRFPPYHEAARIAVRYFDPEKPEALAVANLRLTNVGDPEADIIPESYALARHIRPYGPRESFVPEKNIQLDARDTTQLLSFLRRTAGNTEIETIVVTDKAGDITDPGESLSNQSLTKKLGPQWRLVAEERYNSYCERFYLFNTWRTRVWQRTPANTPP